MNKRAARLRLAVQAPAITTEQGGTQSARERAIAAELLGDPPLFSVRHNLSFNAFLYTVGICLSAAFSLSIYNEVTENIRKVSVWIRKSILSHTHTLLNNSYTILIARQSVKAPLKRKYKPSCKKFVKFSI